MVLYPDVLLEDYMNGDRQLPELAALQCAAWWLIPSTVDWKYIHYKIDTNHKNYQCGAGIKN